jgi:hypothetical protein
VSTNSIPSRCHSGVTGLPSSHAADGWLCDPAGRPIMTMCSEHAAVVIAEYHTKLGESWSHAAPTPGQGGAM